MARLVSQPAIPVIRVKVSPLNYKKILSLAETVGAQLLANIAFYATPSPALATLTTDVTALKAAIAALGTKSNKGSHSAVTAVRSASLTVFNDLNALAAYVTNTVRLSTDVPALQRYNMSLSGFASKKKKTIVPTTQFVRNVRQVNSKKFPPNLFHVRWQKPLGLFTGKQLPSYNIYDMTTGTPVLIATTTSTRITLNPSGNRPFAITSVLVAANNSKGPGNSFVINLI